MTPNQINAFDAGQRLTAVRQRLDRACRAAGRSPGDVRLLAVSKRHPPQAIRDLHALGHSAFGESYVNEGVDKIELLSGLDLEWHLVGPMQSNKTRAAAGHFDWVHSIDRIRIARRLNDQRPEDMPLLNVLVQVNVDDEPQKSGCSPDDIGELADFIGTCPRLTLRGLMAIPEQKDSQDEQRRSFRRLHDLFIELRESHPGIDTLSAGMSGDLEAAIAEGSTMVRVGTALFGSRDEP
ncbi:MAG TPA: YggS family pyridoxal phosphate-dependent enzyme [Wenzhouxiangella sp.]|nr:YggS family pyridoxal phosphate-dependent enzyme [Wenzhouxiangella sp.]